MILETLLGEAKNALYYKLLEITLETMSQSSTDNVCVFKPFFPCHAEIHNY